MAKLTVYLPDDLAGQVRDAGLSTSPVCQQALAAALLGPRVSMGEGGWCRISLGRDRGEFKARFATTDANDLRVVELVTAGAPLTDDIVGAVTVASLLVWGNGPASEGLRAAIASRTDLPAVARGRLDDAERGQAAQRVEWGTVEDDAIADIRFRSGSNSISKGLDRR